MGDGEFWKALEEIGFTVIHTNPLHRSGGIKFDSIGNLEYIPTCDGNYDRIALQMDPLFGTDADYLNLTATAKFHNGFVAGDVVPGRTYIFKFSLTFHIYIMFYIRYRYWSGLAARPNGFP